MAMSEIETYRDQIVFARDYSLKLIDSVPESMWFATPSPPVTHLAWQVGHLAMAEYRMVIERVRGVRPEDAAIISPAFIDLFVRGSVVQPAEHYPAPSEIRAVLDAVHRLVLDELPRLADAELLAAPAMTSHAFCKTKRDCLQWCAHHEMIHAGQIGLLRRLFGEPALW